LLSPWLFFYNLKLVSKMEVLQFEFDFHRGISTNFVDESVQCFAFASSSGRVLLACSNLSKFFSYPSSKLFNISKTLSTKAFLFYDTPLEIEK
jgi:hypothetical protein